MNEIITKRNLKHSHYLVTCKNPKGKNPPVSQTTLHYNKSIIMKRIGSSDSLGALISMCPTSAEHSPTSNNNMYSREYQSILDGFDKDGYIEESAHIPGKKRRLSVDQVKALEKNFEVENKLEPERKLKLAQELGLQPRQVAVWFQNRRARWKTKLLERDYDLLKANFDNLKHNYESLRQDKDSLINKIKVLKSKLNKENSENNICVKEEAPMPDSDSDNNIRVIEPIASPASLSGGCDDAKLLIQKSASDYKDGAASDSNSSSILNEDNNNNNSPYASNSSCGGGFLQNEQQLLSMSPNSPSLRFHNGSSSPSSINCFSFNERSSEGLGSCENHNNNVYHPELVKLEEHNFLSGEEACNFFSDEAPPTLHWDSPHHWT